MSGKILHKDGLMETINLGADLEIKKTVMSQEA
jgi:hypothetical protein